jgi:putative tryptophan/tyrosine transport system substrate-binding protein
MDRRRFLLTSLAGALAAPLSGEAQKGKVWRIGFVLNAPPISEMLGHEPKSPAAKAFLTGLRELGWIEGQNVEIERRSAVGRSDRFPEIMRDLVRLKVDVIVLTSDIAAVAAKEATGSIPIVMAVSAFADKWGLVASLAKPGGNVTGLSMISDASMYAKRLEYLKEIAPGISRVAVLIERGRTDFRWQQMENAARPLRLVLLPVGVDAPDRLTQAFVEVREHRAHGLFVGDEPLFFGQGHLIANLALQHRLPTMSAFREITEAGVLMSLGVNFPAMYRRAASFVDRILKGAKPGDLPIEQPTKFEIVINSKTAKVLGLTIPSSLLLRADQVIE